MTPTDPYAAPAAAQLDRHARGARPWLASVLSLVAPGAGHVYAGRPRLGIALALCVTLAYAGTFGVVLWEPLFGIVAPSVAMLLWLAGVVHAWMQARGSERRGGIRGITGAVLAFWIAFLGATTVMRGSIAEPFNVPSAAMAPTLLPGDKIVADRRAYRDRFPERGDIAVFRFPDDRNLRFIKRVIGLPGERVTVQGRNVWIDDRKFERSPEGTLVVTESIGGGRTRKSELIAEREHLPEGGSHVVLFQPQPPRGDGASALLPTRAWTVPPDCFFAMGDNRDNSQDSTKWQNTFVCREDWIGRAVSRYDSRDPETGELRWDRIGEL
jgi:signal peptidase I